MLFASVSSFAGGCKASSMTLGGVVHVGTLAARGISGLCAAALALLLASCGGGGGGDAVTSTPTYTIGGTVSGLSGTGLVLQNNGGDNRAVSANGAYTSPTGLASGAAYSITVLTQPTNPTQTCTVANGSGTVGSANVTNVAVTCVTNTYTISGTVSGLAGTGLVLQDNGGDDLAIPADGAFTFSTSVASGSPYAVTVLTPPTNLSQTCTVTNGSGTVVSANVSNVSISCATNSFAVGGTVSGHNSTGLTLRLTTGTGTSNVFVPGNGAYAFPALLDGSAYSVTVFVPPVQQVCTVANGIGTLAGANVTNVNITCVTNTYSIGGTVSGLTGTLVLQNNGGDNKTISLTGGFTFNTSIAYGSTYAVTVLTQPANQTCGIANPSGTVTGNVTNVAITCVTNSSTIGGTVFGLSGTGLVLQNMGGDSLAVTSAGPSTPFTFGTPIQIGDQYNVSVLTQPTNPSQNCTVAGGSGTTPASPVTNVVVTCVTNTYTIGGNVSGLTGTGLVLRNNNANDLPIAGNGPFTFSSPVASGQAYSVTVGTQPTNPSQTCTVGSGSGTVGGANVTSVSVTCTTNSYTIGGTITGLTGTGLVLQNNTGNDLTVLAGATTFTFSTSILSGATYAVTVQTQPNTPTQTCTVIANGTGTVGGGNITNVGISCSTNSYTIGGTVTGLAGAGLKLRNNNNPADEITIPKTGPFGFTFSTPIASGQTYAVTVQAQPTALSQTCTVTANGSGTVGGAPVTNVAVNCVTNNFTVGGTVSGSNGTGLTLRLNGTTDLVGLVNGPFTFPAIPDGSTYTVTVQTPPVQQNCTVTNGSGTLAGGSVANIAVSCQTNTYSVGGTITGLTGTGLVLRNAYDLGINTENLTVTAGATTFTFATQVAYNSDYSVTVLTQPSNPTQTCTVTANGAGPITGPVANISISCVTNTYFIGVTVSGLSTAGTTTGVVLQNNGLDNKTVTTNGSSNFITKIASGAGYNVTVLTEPTLPSQTCTVSAPTGTVVAADVNVNVSCVTNTYFIGVTVSGLSTAGTTTGVVLQNNGADNKTVTTNGSSNFATKIASGAGYNVTVLTQPTLPSQTCTVSAPTGTVAGADVNVNVSCVTNTYFIGVTVSGLSTAGTTTGVVLQNNGTDNKTVTTNGASNFTTKIASGAGYDVTVLTQPTLPSQTCTVSAPTGTVGAADVNVNVSCVTNTYFIGVTVSDLSTAGTTTGVVLRNNGTDNKTVTTNGSSNFTTKIASGATYNVTVLTQPTLPSQTCTVSAPTGIVGGADVNVNVSCLTVARFAYVANLGDNSVSIYAANGTTGQLRFRGYVAAGTNPIAVAVDPLGRFAYAANNNKNNAPGNVSAYAINASTGALTEVAGSPFTASTEPYSITVDPSGRFVYVTNDLESSISAYTINSGTGALTQINCGAGPECRPNGKDFSTGVNPRSITIHPSGNFAYVANLFSNTVIAYAINSTTGALAPAGSPFATGPAPRSVTIDPSGRFAYVANGGNPASVSAYSINSGTGALTPVGLPLALTDPQSQPLSVAVDPTGRFAYTANVSTDDVSAFSINATSGALTLVGTVTSGAGSAPVVVTVDPTGKLLYASNATTSNIAAYTIDAATGALTASSKFIGRTTNEGMAITKGVPLVYTPKFAYVANNGSNNVSAYTISSVSGALTSVGSPFTAGTNPASVSVDIFGRFAYVANSGGGVSAYTIDSGTGALAAVAGSPFTAGTNPTSVSVDVSGRFAYVANSGGNVSAYTIDGAGALAAVTGSPFVAGTNPASVALDPSGRFVYVANAGSNNVSAYTIDATTGALAAVAGSPFAAGTNPQSVGMDPSGRFVYVANAGGNVSGYAINPGTGALSAVPNSPFTAGTSPAGVTVDASGKFLYVTNSGGGNVSRFTINATTGELTSNGTVTAGTTPVSVTVDASGGFAYVANSGSGNVSAYTVNSGTGALGTVSGSPFGAGTNPSSVTTTSTVQ